MDDLVSCFSSRMQDGIVNYFKGLMLIVSYFIAVCHLAFVIVCFKKS